jgi:DNA polymerase-1
MKKGTIYESSEARVVRIPTPTKKDRVSVCERAWGKPLAIDTETTGLKVFDGRDYALGVSIAFRGDDGRIEAHYFPFRHVGPDQYPAFDPRYDENYDDEDLENLRILIENAPAVVFHNAKFDLTSLESLGIHYTGQWYDTAVLAYLVNENYPASKELAVLCPIYVGPQCQKRKSKELDLYIQAAGWANVPAGMMRAYGTNDAYITLELAEVIIPLAFSEVPSDYWLKQKAPLMEVVRQMQMRGVRIDVPYTEKMLEESKMAMEDYHELTGGYNPGSFKDMNELLCVKMGLPPIIQEFPKYDKVTKRKYKESRQTFNAAAMAEYDIMLNRLDSPLAHYILAYRGWSKAKGFYESYLRFLSPDGRLRPSYRHHKDEDEGGTVTGRLSCAEPNLQQIPKVTKKSDNKPWREGIKQAFIPKPGYELWEIDYSQLELRLGTAYAREDSLKQIFLEGRDIFTEMAASLEMERQDTKTLVYSMQYGAGIDRLMNALGLSEIKARETRQNYFKTFPGFKRISDLAKQEAEKFKSSELWTKRKRHYVSRADSFKALNSVIQGGAADIMERSMIRVFHEVDQVSNDECRMLLQVHDSIIFEIKQGTADKWIPKASAVMEDVNAMFPFDVRFQVEAKPLHERYQHDFATAA